MTVIRPIFGMRLFVNVKSSCAGFRDNPTVWQLLNHRRTESTSSSLFLLLENA